MLNGRVYTLKARHSSVSRLFLRTSLRTPSWLARDHKWRLPSYNCSALCAWRASYKLYRWLGMLRDVRSQATSQLQSVP